MDEFDRVFDQDFAHKLQQQKLDKELKHSMDASDPSSSTQPGNNNDPVPSSSFPESSETIWDKLKKILGVKN